MPLTWLTDDCDAFPSTKLALKDPNGLLALGGDLSPERLVSAYRRGIFPWFNDADPILWWSPSPRTVIIPGQEHCSASMKKFLRRSPWRVSVDTRFDEVLESCATARSCGTWITAPMRDAYARLHRLGLAHSFEVTDGPRLLGGLYGVALGRVFFGESMFSRADNSSKLALITLSRWLNHNGFVLLDAQVDSDHLTRMGAISLTRESFEKTVQLNTTFAAIEALQANWRAVQGRYLSREGHIQA